MGTPHNIERKNLFVRLDGWVGECMIRSGNIATLWLHPESWNFLDSQLCRESKMEPSVKISSQKFSSQITLNIVDEVIEVDKLNEGNISAAAGKLDK